MIKGLHFIGCRGNTVIQVAQFILEGTMFQGVEGGGTANELAAAEFTLSSFSVPRNDFHIEYI